MLMDKMRQGAQSLTAKIIFVIIMVSFALAGIGGYAVRKPNTDPVEVDGIAIHAMDFDRAYREQKQEIQRQAGEHFAEMIAANPTFLPMLRKQVLSNMVDNLIVDQRVLKLGLRVSDDVIKKVITKDIDAFKVDGKFNNEQYLNVITRVGYTSASQFAQDQKLRMQQSLYTDSFRASQFSLPFENQAFLALQKQERAVDVYNISPDNFVADVTLNDEEMTKFFKEHSNRYVQPEQVKVDYIVLSKSELAKDLKVPDADIQKYYEEHSSNFTEKGKYHVEHIFVNASKPEEKEAAKKKIEEALAKINGGELFETVAKTYSDDVLTSSKGGDLGWQPYGTLEKEFEDAVKSMKTANQVSGVIDTQYGYHLIKFLEAKEDQLKPLDSVKDVIISKINETKVDDVYSEKMDQLSTLINEMPDDLKSIAKEVGLQVQSSNFFDRNTTVVPFDNPQLQKLVFDPAFREEALASEPISIAPDAVAVVYVTGYKEKYTKSQEEVKEQLEKDFRNDKADGIASSKASELEKLLKAGDQSAVDAFVTKNKIVKKNSAALKRTDSSFDSAVVDGIFAMPKASSGVNTAVIDGLDGHKYVAQLGKVTNYSGEISETDASMASSQIKQLNSVRDFELLKKQLRADSKIEFNEYALKQYASNDGLND